MQKYLEAGKVVTTHGVRGEMKLELWCDGVAFLKKVGRLYTTPQGGRCYKITSIRPQGQMALLQLEGVGDMDAARALRGQVFYFDRDDATLPAGKWYVADLIGCEVRDAGHRRGNEHQHRHHGPQQHQGHAQGSSHAAVGHSPALAGLHGSSQRTGWFSGSSGSTAWRRPRIIILSIRLLFSLTSSIP